MTFCVLVAGLFAAGGSNVLWLYPYEIDASGIDIPQAGTYHVWLWIPDDGKGSVTLNGKELGAEANVARKKNNGVWVKAGEVDLAAGKCEARLGDTVAAIALSTDAGFDPSKSVGDVRAYSRPEGVRDMRAETAKHTDTVFTMPVYSSREEWEAFAAKLRKRILLSCGLLPLPERTPLKAEVFGRITHEDYSVEKVHFEARPGFLVTGNLYRPVGKQGPFPGVVNPHGHWKEGRLADEALGSVPGRCVTLARMGMVAFSYDMIGYNDSLQFDHRFGGETEKLWGISPFAMQLWSSIRAVDFLQSLPDVDPERIGCTGASGGGTQTFALMSVDPRVKVAAPVNMISHSMQGGCLCENAPILRLNNSNMEIGALMAPRPLLMVAATGDWTRETPRVEYPAIRSVYALYGAEDKLHMVQVDADHNYNKASREAMYRFFGKWLIGGDQWATFAEPDFKVEKQEDLRVFPDKKLPEGLPAAAEILSATEASTDAKWQAVLPKSPADCDTFRKDYGDALSLTLGTSIPEANDLDPERVGYEERREQGYVVERWVLHRRCVGDAIPALLYRVYGPQVQDAVIVVHGKGKAALADIEKGGPGPLVAGLIAQGKAVLAIDAFLLGEHSSPWKRVVRKTVGTFMDTFQPTDTGYRVQDVLTSVSYLKSRRDLSGKIDVVGLEEGGPWCMLASAIDDRIGKTIVDANHLNPDDDDAWTGQLYIPCIRSIGGLETAAALIAPRPLLCFNATDTFATRVNARYSAAAADTAKVSSDAMPPEAILEVLR